MPEVFPKCSANIIVTVFTGCVEGGSLSSYVDMVRERKSGGLLSNRRAQMVEGKRRFEVFWGLGSHEE
jgi:hypothetical protein